MSANQLRVFVGYGYRDAELWVEEFIFPIVEAIGAKVISGKEIPGQELSDGIQAQIRDCDAVLCVTPHRPDGQGSAGTSAWVSNELVTAQGFGKPLLEVREVGVGNHAPMLGDRQYLEYMEAKRDECLVEVAQAVAAWWKSLRKAQLRLSPGEFVEALRPKLRDPNLRCTYVLRGGNRSSGEEPAKIVPITGGLYIDVRHDEAMPLIQVAVEVDGQRWASDFEPVAQTRIEMIGHG